MGTHWMLIFSTCLFGCDFNASFKLDLLLCACLEIYSQVVFRCINIIKSRILVYTHLSWEWCMKKPNEGNSGVWNIVHRGEAEWTIFCTPLLPKLVFFMHHDQERCVYSLQHVISLILSHLKMFFSSISKNISIQYAFIN